MVFLLSQAEYDGVRHISRADTQLVVTMDVDFCRQPLSPAPCAAQPCFAGVDCTDQLTLTGSGSGYSCSACPPGYTGDGENCVDTDDCGLVPCFAGVACTDAVAPATGYSCGPCPAGYTGDGSSCTLVPVPEPAPAPEPAEEVQWPTTSEVISRCDRVAGICSISASAGYIPPELVKVASRLTVAADIEDIPAGSVVCRLFMLVNLQLPPLPFQTLLVGMQERLTFEDDFKSAMASQSEHISAEDVVIDAIVAGSIQVDWSVFTRAERSAEVSLAVCDLVVRLVGIGGLLSISPPPPPPTIIFRRPCW